MRPRVVRGTTQRAIEPTPSSPMHVLCPRLIRCTGRRMEWWDGGWNGGKEDGMMGKREKEERKEKMRQKRSKEE